MTVTFREASRDDVRRIIELLADDVLGRDRERGELAAYEAVFDVMAEDANNTVIVGVSGGVVVACYQLTIIPGLSLSAATRAQIEGVRVAAELRGSGIGKALVADAETRARKAGATLLQLTMNRTREDSRRFYVAQGFVPSHVGFKKPL